MRGTKIRQRGVVSELVILIVKENGALSGRWILYIPGTSLWYGKGMICCGEWYAMVWYGGRGSERLGLRTAFSSRVLTEELTTSK